MVSKHTSFSDSRVAGILFAPLKWCFVTVLLLLPVIMAAWLVDWILVTRVWPDGPAQLERAVALELAWAQHIGAV